MSLSPTTYCLDANVLIQAWQKYYSPKFCPDYWSVLNDLGKQNRIFLAEEIHQEIVRTEDELTDWLKTSDIPIAKTDAGVIASLKTILDSNPLHKLLVDDGASQTVFNDNDVDTLTGSQGTDWFFANHDGPGVLDIITDKAANELWSDTDF